jgi:hypothetical protein
MKKLLLVAAGIAASTAAQAASIDLGGRFNPGMSSGYVDAIIHNSVATDGTGDSLNDEINFSTPPAAPIFEVVTLNTPNYGVITADFSNLVSFDVTPAGEFFTLAGNFNGDGYGTLSVNLVNPGFGISSFGIFGNFTYTAPSSSSVFSSDPGVPSDPPLPSLGYSTPVFPSVPETSTWLMLLAGFAALALARYSHSHALRRGGQGRATPVATTHCSLLDSTGP